jgi:phospholipase C
MVNKGIIFKFVMVMILLEACSLTAPVSNSVLPAQPNAPQVNDTPTMEIMNPGAISSMPIITPTPTIPSVAPITSVLASPPAASDSNNPAALALARQKIKHIVIIMQENRSFDSYFGTYPGADGIPSKDGSFTICVNDPKTGQCVAPYHDPANRNFGGPHGANNASADIDGGKMDGFIAQAQSGKGGCAATNSPNCGNGMDVMGYHDAREIPNYWNLAKYFVLQDHLFEPNSSWSLPQHLFMISEWSAKCSRAGDPMSCINALQSPANPPDFAPSLNLPNPDYAWTDLTYLLFKKQVAWKYYVQTGTEPDCANDAEDCPPVHQNAKTPGIWNP